MSRRESRVGVGVGVTGQGHVCITQPTFVRLLFHLVLSYLVPQTCIYERIRDSLSVALLPVISPIRMPI